MKFEDIIQLLENSKFSEDIINMVPDQASLLKQVNEGYSKFIEEVKKLSPEIKEDVVKNIEQTLGPILNHETT